jgi:hypothetical protein
MTRSGNVCCERAVSVSNCDHAGTVKECMRGMGAWARRVPVSETDKFWLYAKEAILSISYAKTDEDRQGFLDLAGIWTKAAYWRGTGPAITIAGLSFRQIESIALVRYRTLWILRWLPGRELIPWVANEDAKRDRFE